MALSINDFKSQLVSGGARPSLFQVQITNPITSVADFKTSFMVYSAAIPESSQSPYEVHYLGRSFKFAGNRTFSDWTVEIYNDEDFSVRNSMESWMNAMNGHTTNQRVGPKVYKSQAQVIQLSQAGEPIREYTFEGLFPSNISPIQLSMDADGIERFSVTFQYDLWRNSGGTTGSSTS